MCFILFLENILTLWCQHHILEVRKEVSGKWSDRQVNSSFIIAVIIWKWSYAYHWWPSITCIGNTMAYYRKQFYLVMIVARWAKSWYCHRKEELKDCYLESNVNQSPFCYSNGFLWLPNGLDSLSGWKFSQSQNPALRTSGYNVVYYWHNKNQQSSGSNSS